MTSRWPTAPTSWRTGASALAAALLLPACGAEGGDGGAEAAPPPPPAIELRVEFFPKGPGAGGASATVTCDPAGGTHPRPEEACAALAAHPEALDPVPPEAVCTQVYGGDETATVAGVVRGQEVDASFNRTNGCEIARWEAL
ncbi:MAG: SSI family serine proteinase inhibitor, partial [Gaiellaceae bacterium]